MHSRGLRIGPSIAQQEDVPLRDVGDAMDTAVPLFTGERFVSFEGDFVRDARIVISGTAPLPFTLLAAAPALKTNELLCWPTLSLLPSSRHIWSIPSRRFSIAGRCRAFRPATGTSDRPSPRP